MTTEKHTDKRTGFRPPPRFLGLQPGPRLDSAIAAEIMGWREPLRTFRIDEDGVKKNRPLLAFRVRSGPGDPSKGRFLLEDGQEVADGRPFPIYLPDRWSSELYSAYKVVERLARIDYAFDLERSREGCYVTFTRPGGALIEARASSVPLAICSAALGAVRLNGDFLGELVGAGDATEETR